MRFQFVRLPSALLIGCILAVPVHAQRRWTVRDGIELSTFLRSGSQHAQSPQVRFSPDGAHFIAATMRGDLGSGQRKATFWVFDSKPVDAYLRSPQGKAFDAAKSLLTVASASNRDPISGWRWSANSQDIVYLAADDDGARHLYRAGLQDGVPVAASLSDQDVSRFDESNGTIVYLAHKPIHSDDLYQAGGATLPDIVDATGQNLLPLVFPNWMDAQFQRSDDELWRLSGGSPGPVLSGDRKTPIQLRDSKLALSPDGRLLLVTVFVQRIPKSWERYKPRRDYPGLKIVADTPDTVGSSGYYRPKQYAVVNLDEGSISPLADSPVDLLANFNDAVTAAWSEDGTRVALPGAYPPLRDAAESGAIYPCTVAVVEIKSKIFSCLDSQKAIDAADRPHASRLEMLALHWRNEGKELVAQFGASNAPDRKVTRVYLLGSDGKWSTRGGDQVAAKQNLVVEVRESLDQPPILVASSATGRSRIILDPNPTLNVIERGTVDLYHWRDGNGAEWTGALVKPPKFKQGHRYPLVIQTHNLERAKFLTSGPSASGFAARALAARDIVVLQVDEHVKDLGTPKEAKNGAAGYRAAISQLVKDGVVDSGKVGIIAWSHMGPYVLQGMIDQPSTYKAATIAEADFNSYPEYLKNIDYMGKEREQMFRDMGGGEKPFGKGLQKWLENSPGFQLDSVCSPIMFMEFSPAALIYGWDDYAALRAQDKPVELAYVRNGAHVLAKPLQRLAIEGRSVDWYDYWLNGHKDHDPTKSAQYKRWDGMKASLPACQK